MSRIGRRPVEVPPQVTLQIHERYVEVQGPLGKLEAIVPQGVTLRHEGTWVYVDPPAPSRNNRGFQGLMRALLANMIHGVVHGYKQELEIVGVGYKAELEGDSLVLSLGYTHPIQLKLPDMVKVAVERAQSKVMLILRSPHKQQVGQVAAQICHFRRADPYKGKGVHRVGKPIRRKAGKAGK